MFDTDRPLKVHAREARRYRRLLRETIFLVEGLLPEVAKGGEEGRRVQQMLSEVIQDTKRVLWPRGFREDRDQ